MNTWLFNSGQFNAPLGETVVIAFDAAADVRKDVQQEHDSLSEVRRCIHRSGSAAVVVRRAATRSAKARLDIRDAMAPADYQTRVDLRRAKSRTARSITEIRRSRIRDAAIYLNAVYPVVNEFATTIRVPSDVTATFDTLVSVMREADVAHDTSLEIRRTPAVLAATAVQIENVWFRKNIWNLLPAVYQERDNGDLDAILTLFAELFDAHKTAADQLPDKWSIERCAPEYLPRLAAMLDWPWDPKRDSERQRHDLMDAVEYYRRKGTIPAILRSLEATGWRGTVEETFRSTIRLVTRSVLNQHRIAGQVFNQGVFRLNTDTHSPEVRTALDPHVPAGVRVFQVLHEHKIQDGLEPEAFGVRGLTRSNRVVAADRFQLCKDRLNQYRHLTRRRVVDHLVLANGQPL